PRGTSALGTWAPSRVPAPAATRTAPTTIAVSSYRAWSDRDGGLRTPGPRRGEPRPSPPRSSQRGRVRRPGSAGRAPTYASPRPTGHGRRPDGTGPARPRRP